MSHKKVENNHRLCRLGIGMVGDVKLSKLERLILNELARRGDKVPIVDLWEVALRAGHDVNRPAVTSAIQRMADPAHRASKFQHALVKRWKAGRETVASLAPGVEVDATGYDVNADEPEKPVRVARETGYLTAGDLNAIDTIVKNAVRDVVHAEMKIALAKIMRLQGATASE